MERGKELLLYFFRACGFRRKNEGEREDGEANSSLIFRIGYMEIGRQSEKLANNLVVSSAVLREDIVDLLDLIERLKNEDDQIVLDRDQIEKLKLELTFMSSCLQLCYYISDDTNAETSCISYEVHDLVQSLVNQSGDYMLVSLKNHVVPRLLENIRSSIISDHQSEASAIMTEDQLVELLDALLVNLHYLPKVIADESFPVLEELRMHFCIKLKEIPESFGDIVSLKYILVMDSDQLEESARKIKEYVAEMTGEEDKLTVEFAEMTGEEFKFYS